MAQRVAKAEELRAAGIDPYPLRTSRTHTASDVTGLVEALPEGESEVAGVEADVAGRVVAKRDMGKATFIDLQDGSGRVQALLRKNSLDDYESLRLIDLGDFIGVHGSLMRTRTVAQIAKDLKCSERTVWGVRAALLSAMGEGQNESALASSQKNRPK